jgi:two-component system, cell cycle sensor histidine kinase and response regulator CckA
MSTSVRALMVEDSEDDVQLVLDALRTAGHEPAFERVETAAAMAAALDRQEWDIVISDYRMPRFSGPAALELLKSRELDIPFILVSGTVGEEAAVEAMRLGADDYLLKDRLGRLGMAVSHALAARRLRAERKQAEMELRAANERYARHQAALIALTHSPAFQAGQLSGALREIAEVTARALNVGRVSVWRYERDRRDIVCMELYERGGHRHSAGVILKQEDYPAYFRILAEADVIAAHDAHHDPRTAEFSASYLGPHGIGAMLDAPVHVQGAMAGVLCCEHIGPARQWTADEQTFAVAVANLTSLVLAQAERRQVEEKLLRSQRMENIGALAGGIAHDLNNVLAPILMSGEILRMSVHDPELIRVIDSIMESAQRGAGMVRQVLTFSRGTEDKRGSVQVKHLLREMVGIAQQTFPKSIRIRSEVAKDTWTVNANPTKLHQVLLNLCVNARDAMPGGGTLRIAASNVRLDEAFAGMSPGARPGPYVCLTVADTGTGMTPEVRARIFDAFFTTKEPGKGTGLGLSTVQGIVKDHGGFITVDSTPGKGTEFKVYLPAQMEAVAVAEGEQLQPPVGSGELVLVVDDEASIRNIATQTLQMFGYRVLSAKDGAEGLAMFMRQRNEIQLVLTDMAMPVMDGTGMIRVIRTIQPRIPVILTSGLDSQAARFDTTELETQAFLHKPYRAEELLKTVDAVLHPQPQA